MALLSSLPVLCSTALFQVFPLALADQLHFQSCSEPDQKALLLGGAAQHIGAKTKDDRCEPAQLALSP